MIMDVMVYLREELTALNVSTFRPKSVNMTEWSIIWLEKKLKWNARYINYVARAWWEQQPVLQWVADKLEKKVCEKCEK